MVQDVMIEIQFFSGRSAPVPTKGIVEFRYETFDMALVSGVIGWVEVRLDLSDMTFRGSIGHKSFQGFLGNLNRL